MSIQWQYVIPLKENNLIEDFECAVTYEFPNSFKECVVNNNGGSPSLSAFDTNKTKERDMKSLFSFNKEDEENIWIMNEWDGNDLDNMFIAFAIDNFGNLICFDVNNDSIVFWNHETNETEFVANSFDEFLGKLYK
ncbi:MAG: SMI1/KNR4 family protein [Gammaproteobacteria bacterium]|nr:SMI1/KNR4 family protein [Gammaproteobacteria bacterium]